MTNLMRGRLATAMVSLSLLLAVNVATADAINQVMPGDNGGMICANCGPPNRATTTGNATGGTVTNNGNGTQNTSMSYVPPNDGTVYTGTVSITVNDANGNNLYSYTGTITDQGNGVTMYTGLDGIYIPPGANIFISVSEGNWITTFKASWHLQNYQP
jgi:hypothetical protein